MYTYLPWQCKYIARGGSRRACYDAPRMSTGSPDTSVQGPVAGGPVRRRWVGGLRLRRGDRGPLLVTVLAVVLCWAWTYEMWTPAALGRPFEYWQDAMYQLGVVKAYGDRGLSSLWGGTNAMLGAPGEASWADFPISEDVVYLGVGLVSRLTGPVAALNLAFLGTAVLSAVCLFLVARRLRVSAPFAGLAGALFGLSPFLHWRNLHHFNLAVYWPLPLGVLVWVWASSRRGLSWGEGRMRWALVFSALLAVHNNYFLNYYLQVLLLVGVLQALRRRWAAMRAVGVLLAVAMGIFFLVNADTLVQIARLGRNVEAVNRGAADVLVFALRPLELFIPSPLHRIPVFATLGAGYRATAPVTGEFPSTFLGILGCVGFVAMLLTGLRGLLFSEGRGMASRFSLFSIWLVFVAMGGGLMQLSQTVLRFVAFRSNNRVSILLMALSLLFLGRLVMRWTKGWKRGPVLALAGALTVFGLWEEAVDRDKLVFPANLGTWQQVRAWFEKKAASDQQFAAGLEEQLPDGAALLELPPMAFPEGGGAPGVYDYDLFRPYLWTKTLRFSYGAMKGRPEGAFQFTVSRLPAPQMVQELDGKGFKGVVFHLGHYQLPVVQQWMQQAATVVQPKLLVSPNQDFAAVTW